MFLLLVICSHTPKLQQNQGRKEYPFLLDFLLGNGVTMEVIIILKAQDSSSTLQRRYAISVYFLKSYSKKTGCGSMDPTRKLEFTKSQVNRMMK